MKLLIYAFLIALNVFSGLMQLVGNYRAVSFALASFIFCGVLFMLLDER